MKVQVRLYAALVRLVPGATAGTPLEVDLPEGSTLAELVAAIHLPAPEVKVIFANGRAREMSYTLAPGDRVGIFPLVGGG